MASGKGWFSISNVFGRFARSNFIVSNEEYRYLSVALEEIAFELGNIKFTLSPKTYAVWEDRKHSDFQAIYKIIPFIDFVRS